METEAKIVTPTAEQLAAILADHKLWLLGGGGKQADLRSADLSFADLSSANLRYANLRSANLRSANLRSANLRYADLRSANLSSANLSSADLRSANLRSANLSSANLSSADLSSANLSEIKNAKLVLARTEILPREGEVIGWKKCVDNRLVKLRIPADAKRSNAPGGRKCRAERAEVLEVVGGDVAISLHDRKTEYRVGAIITPHEWNTNRLVECAGGVHFYLNRDEAEAHE